VRIEIRGWRRRADHQGRDTAGRELDVRRSEGHRLVEERCEPAPYGTRFSTEHQLSGEQGVLPRSALNPGRRLLYGFGPAGKSKNAAFRLHFTIRVCARTKQALPYAEISTRTAWDALRS